MPSTLLKEYLSNRKKEDEDLALIELEHGSDIANTIRKNLEEHHTVMETSLRACDELIDKTKANGEKMDEDIKAALIEMGIPEEVASNFGLDIGQFATDPSTQA